MSLQWKLRVGVLILVAAFLGLLMVARIPAVWPPLSANVFEEFREDLIDWNDANDRGWWEYWIHPDSDRDPEELCEAIHAAMVEKFPWAIPGIGVSVHEWVDTSNDPAVFPTEPNYGPGYLAYCGMPDWWGDPRGA